MAYRMARGSHDSVSIQNLSFSALLLCSINLHYGLPDDGFLHMLCQQSCIAFESEWSWSSTRFLSTKTCSLVRKIKLY